MLNYKLTHRKVIIGDFFEEWVKKFYDLEEAKCYFNKMKTDIRVNYEHPWMSHTLILEEEGYDSLTLDCFMFQYYQEALDDLMIWKLKNQI